MKQLHIYSPAQPHCDGYVVGTPEGLKILRDAIDRALIQQGAVAEVCGNDGEAYSVYIAACIEDGLEHLLAVPYTDHDFKETRSLAIRPHELITTTMYQKILDKYEEKT